MIVCTETVFTLHTTHTSYQLAVAPNGMVLHTYYGTRLPEDVPSLADARMPHSDPGCWPDLLPQELSGCGTADNRTPAVIPEYADGTEAAAFVFDHAVVTPGKPQLPGLPMFRTGEGVETLSVFLKDAGGLVVELRYSVYEAEDLITRTAVYTNAGTQSLTLHKAASLSVDFAPDALELITPQRHMGGGAHPRTCGAALRHPEHWQYAGRPRPRPQPGSRPLPCRYQRNDRRCMGICLCVQRQLPH